jgi:hypothetical protein
VAIAPPAAAVVERRGAMVQLGDLFHERESQPGALLAVVRTREGVEAIEDTCRRVVGNPGTFVAHGNHSLGIERLDLDHDRTVRRREIDRVFEQVRDRTHEQQRIATQRDLGTGRQLELDAPALRTRCACVHRRFGGRAQTDRNQAFEATLALERRELEQPIDEFLHACRLAQDVDDETRAIGLRASAPAGAPPHRGSPPADS